LVEHQLSDMPANSRAAWISAGDNGMSFRAKPFRQQSTLG
jgi:hypothetical protein